MNQENALPIKFIAVYPDLETKEFTSLENATQSTPWLIVSKTYNKPHITGRGNEYSLFNYTTFDTNGNAWLPEYNNWKVFYIHEGLFSSRREPFLGIGASSGESWGPAFRIQISDPLGELRTQVLYKGSEIVMTLFHLGKFHNWKEFDLQLENQQLIEQLNMLKETIE